MRQCTHARKGIVTNQPDSLDLKRSHAARTVCDREPCITAAKRWVAAKTNETAYYVPDDDPEPPAMTATAHGPVNHPAHYTAHPSGVECITVVEHMSFNVGNAIKYLWRADLKGSALEDLEKAAWYVRREIERRRAS